MSEQPPIKDDIFATAARPADFVFDERVAEVFDDMLVRSIPFYVEQQHMFREIAKGFWKPGTRVYDLGCSTGFTLAGIAEELGAEAELVGIDNSPAMLDRARANLTARGLGDRITLVTGDLNAEDGISIANASLVTLCWTLQFVRPLHRDYVIRRISEGLVDGGALVVAEKVVGGGSAANRFFIDSYHDFKRRNGYSATEIARKREALENVLVPYRMEENVELFRRNGFEAVDVFFRWYNFAAFLCVKTP